MAYTWQDSRGYWLARFLPLGGTKQKPRRVPAARLEGAADPKAAADAWAARCEAACGALRSGAYTADDVREALALTAISDEEAGPLLSGRAPSVAELQPVTIEQAALAHPSTQRAKPRARWEYLGFVKQFCASLGSSNLYDVTLAAVLTWVGEMKAAGLSPATRRHRLLYVRRACKMSPTLIGKPDVLGGMQLDVRAKRQEVKAWTPEELARGLVALERAGDWRRLCATALQGCLGLRPSECWRVLVGDLRDGVLEVGERERKNDPSRRSLPVPPTVAAWLARLTRGRKDDAPLILTRSPRRPPGPFTLAAGGRWLAKPLSAAVGRSLPAKALRKTFATWCSRLGVDPLRAEAYMGHDSALHGDISSRHYLARYAQEQLRPVADAIEAAIAPLLKAERARAATRPATPRPKSRRSKVDQAATDL